MWFVLVVCNFGMIEKDNDGRVCVVWMIIMCIFDFRVYCIVDIKRLCVIMI